MKDKLRILVVVPSYKPAFVYGGPIKSIANLCETMYQAGHEVTVYTTNANGSDDLAVELNKVFSIDGVSIIYHKRWTGDHTNFSPALLFRFFRYAKSFDVVHIQSWWNLICVPVAWICLLRGIRPVISLRGTMTQFSLQHKNATIKKMMHLLGGKMLLNRSILHSTSIREDQRLAAFVDTTDRFVIPNILKHPDILKGLNGESTDFKIVFLGRIDPAKNLELLMNIFNDDFPFPYSVSIVGEGDEEYKRHLTSLSSYNSNIEWKGNLDGDEKWNELAKSDLLVLPSHIENYGNVVVEALSQGTAVLVSEEVGAREFVEKHQLGWVVKAEKNAWRNAIFSIRENVEKRNWIRKNAPEIVKKELSVCSIHSAYIHMYEICMDRKNKSIATTIFTK